MVAADGKGLGQGHVTFKRSNDTPEENLPLSFIDHYTEWASTVTDAPVQYHRVTATVILSTLMTPYIALETSYGVIRPNIWAMILAGTTVTRKSTSMDLAMAMLDDVTDDYMLATDGSPEGLLTELALRDGKVSVFHRDEITGFMSQISGRDYLAGLLESFTRLYDGKREKRILRKESIEIEKPRLVFLAGGIKTKMQELVGMEHIRSGFIPRFLFVTGTTTADQIRPIGPPVKKDKSGGEYIDVDPRDKVLDMLYKINNHYSSSGEEQAVVRIAGITKVSQSVQRDFDIEASPKAWDRIRKLKDDAIVLGERSSAPELYTPLYDRLSNTVIKVAILLAGAELETTIEVRHIVKAIHLSQEWIDAVTEFASAIEQAPEMNPFEKKIDKIIYWVNTQHPKPVTERDIMMKFRIRKKDMSDIRTTCVDRGLIDIDPPKPGQSHPGTKIFWSSTTQTKLDQQAKHDRATMTRVQREDSYVAQTPGHEKNKADGNKTNGHEHKLDKPGRIRIPTITPSDTGSTGSTGSTERKAQAWIDDEETIKARSGSGKKTSFGEM